MLKGIHWLGHASFRIEDGVVLYIDPWKLAQALPADIILITHGHHDHLSKEDIARISKPGTVIVAPGACRGQLKGDVRAVKPGDSLQIGEVSVEAVPSYNTNKPNHPRSANNVGYIVSVGGRRIYHAGDTDLIPEMSSIRCDVALLPIGGAYTMNAEEAAEAAKRIAPSVVVPMHWGDIVGSAADVERLKKRIGPGIEVAALKPER